MLNKLLIGFGVLSNTATLVGLWISYVSAPQNLQPIIAHRVLMSGGTLSAMLYLYLAYAVLRSPKQASGVPPDHSDDHFLHPRWQIVNSRRFENESILVDGRSFRSCTFKNVTFVFHGTAPTEFTGQSQFEGSIRLSTNHPPTMFWRTLEHMFSTIPGAEVQTSPVDDKGKKLEPKVEGFPVAADDEAQLSLELAHGEIHSYDPTGKSYFFVRSCCPRFLRSIRFDPVESRSGQKIWLEGIASLSPGERAPVGFHAGEDGKHRGVVNHLINFFEGGTSPTDQPPYQITARFLDGDKEKTERHTIEGHPLPKGGVRLKIVPTV